VDGSVDFAWSNGKRRTFVDYNSDRRKRRRLGQLQLHAMALQRLTGLPAREL